MLARARQSLRTANQKVAAKSKHTKVAARRRKALATVKETLRQWRAAEEKCNCDDFLLAGGVEAGSSSRCNLARLKPPCVRLQHVPDLSSR